MKLNADKTEEVVYSCKREKSIYPVLKLGDEIISTKSEHKHLGFVLDSKLNFKSHIREANLKARRGIGLTKYHSKYVSRGVLDQIISFILDLIWIMVILYTINMIQISN